MLKDSQSSWPNQRPEKVVFSVSTCRSKRLALSKKEKKKTHRKVKMFQRLASWSAVTSEWRTTKFYCYYYCFSFLPFGLSTSLSFFFFLLQLRSSRFSAFFFLFSLDAWGIEVGRGGWFHTVRICRGALLLLLYIFSESIEKTTTSTTTTTKKNRGPSFRSVHLHSAMTSTVIT